MNDIEYFYSAHSAFAYIGSAKLQEIAKRNNARLIHRPMDLRRVTSGMGGATNSLTPLRRAYFSRREIERWAEYRGVPIMCGIPTHHAKALELSNGVLIAAMREGLDLDGLAHAMLKAHWVDDCDLADPDALKPVIEAAGCPAAPLLAMALTPETQAICDANTAEAIARSVFGSPTYFVGGDMFYGQDHLELVEQAVSRPFAKTWPED